MSDFEKVIEECKNSIDENLVDFARDIINGIISNPNSYNYSLGDVSSRAVTDVSELTGINIAGFKHNIKGNYIKHIDNRHGKSGVHDHTMADINDLGIMGYILDKYDGIELLYDKNGNVEISTEFKNFKNESAPLVRYSKRINGNFYVVEAVPDAKAKQLQIVSAYKGKAKTRGGQMPDVVQTPRLNVRNAYAATPVISVKNKDGQMLDAVQTPKPHVQNEFAAIPVISIKTRGRQVLDGSQTPEHHVQNELAVTPVDNLTHLQEKVNTTNRNSPP